MLNLCLTNTSVVALSQGNNPSLLNPDFLERNAIVPRDWKPTQVVVTPPFATVQYENGVTILVEESKLQFTAIDPSRLNWAEELPKVARRYLEVLPHVAYTAAGLNFTHLSDDVTGEAAEHMLVNRFLCKGDWQAQAGGLTSTVLELQFHKTYPYLNLKVGLREVLTEIGKALEGLIFSANFHQEFKPDERKELAEFISSIEKRESDLRALLAKLPLEKQ